MLKETIEYEDFNGVTRKEDFFFNLTRAELINLQNRFPGGLSYFISGIVKSENTSEVVSFLQELIMQAYGVKSDDGRTFKKSKELREEFLTSEAYSTLLFNLIDDQNDENGTRLSKFVEGIMPAKMIADSNAIIEKYGSPEAAIDAIQKGEAKA